MVIKRQDPQKPIVIKLQDLPRHMATKLQDPIRQMARQLSQNQAAQSLSLRLPPPLLIAQQVQRMRVMVHV